MNILTVNPGSRWVKCALFSDDGAEPVRRRFDADERQAMVAWFKKCKDVGKVGVRVVHGGHLESPTKLTEKALGTIKLFNDFAPQHNHKTVAMVETLQKVFPKVPIYGLFDTHFHKQMPARASTYPLPSKVTGKHAIKRYGFHGLAFESVLEQLHARRKEEGRAQPERVIMAHLGGGTSIAAVENGVCIDTTMGLTPLEGLMMATRSGNIDPDLPRILLEREKLKPQELSELLNTQSGFQGLVGHSDTKEIFDTAVVDGSEPERLAYEMYVHQVVKQIYAYYGVLQGADVLTFSGGIGFRNIHIRPEILKHTKLIGLTEENTYAFEADEATVMQRYLAAVK